MNDENICLLCLKELELMKSVYIFKEYGANETIASIIVHHFWFDDINADDDNKSKICGDCWKILETFHNFYQEIRDVHQNQKDMLMTKIDQEDLNLTASENLQEADILFSFSDDKSNSLSNLEESIHSSQLEDKHDDTDNSVVLRKSIRLSEKNSSSTENLNNRSYKIKDKVQINKKNENSEKDSDEIKTYEDNLVSNYMKLICSICNTEQKTFTDLKRHYKKEHNQTGFVMCCESVFHKRCRFMEHIKTHICPEKFKCPICGKALKNNKSFVSHNKYMHSNKFRKFVCDIDLCRRIFKNKANLMRHKLTHIPENEWQYKCADCDKSFPSQGVLRTHRTAIHESRYSGICDLCGKRYQNSQDLKRHRLEHDGIKEPKAQCEICGDWVINKYKLKRHMIIHSTGVFKCHLCDKVSPNPLALKGHIRYMHLKKKTHQCSICDKVFRRAINLKEHMTVHTGQALYICPHCPRTFTHHSNMHHHRKKMHRKEFDDDRKNRGERTETWNKVTELKCETTSTEVS